MMTPRTIGVSGARRDEIAGMRYQQAVFDAMMLGLRLGDRPRVLIATTPKTTPFIKLRRMLASVREPIGILIKTAALAGSSGDAMLWAHRQLKEIGASTNGRMGIDT